MRLYQKTLATTLSVLSVLTIAGTAAAASGDWHQYHKAGAIGVVDLADQKMCEFKNGRVKIKNSKETATAVIRYDIEHGLNGHRTPDYVAIIPRYRDNGDEARVIIRLKTYNIGSGSTTTLLTFDSDDYDQSDDYRVDNINVHDPGWQFLNGNAYWFEVTLEKTGEGGAPELGMIRYIWREA